MPEALRITLIVVGSILAVWLLFVIVDLIFVGSYSAIFKKHKKAMIVILYSKLENMKKIFSIVNHSGIKIENGVPAIVSEDLFNAVQIEIAKNAHAPARHTADEDYLLTTKLFCGKCGAMMVAQAGTSSKGPIYRYYACVRQKKHLCDKKMVSKTKLEDFIVHKTMEFLNNEDVIERLSELLFKLQYSESTMLPHLEEQLSNKEKEIENIVSAVQKGYATDTLLKRLGELEKQRNEINDSITKEKLKSPIFTQEHFKMALCNFRKIDITKQDGKRKIIDTFINSIFLYDDHLKIVYNGNGKEETITLDELESSTLFSQGAPEIVRNYLTFFVFNENLIFVRTGSSNQF